MGPRFRIDDPVDLSIPGAIAAIHRALAEDDARNEQILVVRRDQHQAGTWTYRLERAEDRVPDRVWHHPGVELRLATGRRPRHSCTHGRRTRPRPHR
jgi:hypothetical protein